jgi:protein-S-isoprenylcysteine O-methyltransferase Ste14
MDTLELKIPPPLVALIVALLMWLTASVTAPVEVQFIYRLCAALALALAGSAVRLAAQIAFWRASTTVNPTNPDHTSAIVRSGVYRFTRNPMYLGRALQLLGWASFLASPIAFLLVPLYLVYVNRFQVVPEERALLAQFGPAYEVYQSEVRRWL